MSDSDANINQELQTIFDEYWGYRLRENPLLATSFGASHFNDRLPENSPEAHERRCQKEQEFLQRLKELPADEISPSNRLNYKLLTKILEWSIAEYNLGTRYFCLDQISGFQVSFPQLWLQIPLQSTEDYEDYIKRMASIRKYVADLKRLLQNGISKNMVPASVTLKGVDDQLEKQIVDQPENSDFFTPFEEMPSRIPQQKQQDLIKRGKQVITKNVIPAFESFRTFFQEHYQPAARSSISCRNLPNGTSLYHFLVQKHTTRDLSPDEIHELGKREVQRIKSNMDHVIDQSEFKGNFHEFIQYLRTSDQYYFDDSEELLRTYRDICKRMDAKLPILFGKLPRTTYGVREIPEHAAQDAPTAYYMRAAGDRSRPGWFFANTSNLNSRPKYEMEALALHETVPGHHLQLSLQQEQAGLVDFRKAVSFTAYVEGWGLYAERLGKEVGFYQKPSSEFGRLSYDMWRSLRLVVDTGIHAKDWSRDKAIEYMQKYSALTKENIKNEVDRYIAWPGQALSYKIGERTITKLRQKAERKLQSRFDIREFHDKLLETGAIPLDILEERMMNWIEVSSHSTPDQSPVETN